MPDTVQDGQFLNGLKHKIRAIVNDLDAQGAQSFENNSREAHEIRHAMKELTYALENHGITLQESKGVSEEEIQQAIEAVQEIWVGMKSSGEPLHSSMREQTLHPALASNILAYESHVNTSHWTEADGFRFQRAWDAAGRK